MGKDKIKVVVIGGGISGIASGIRLSEALGAKLDLTILEKGASPGGVWRDSKWPGAGVDVPIHLYSLYSDLSPEWDSVFASQPEVLAYWERLVDKHELRDTFLFHNEFVGSDWDAATQTHTVHVRNVNTGARTKLTANVLISAAGPLAKPLLPNIPGIESFQGAYFHNLRWDSSVPLEGKRVAVIGNGSSGIQLIVRPQQIALTPARRRGPPRRPAHPLHPLGRVLCPQACV
jgi:cation diffusion facilitator CzcD-associated flavoprotein CzcO